MRATIKDIAVATGFSVTTISLVLNGKAHKISDKTKKRILDAAEQMHYRPNQLAVSLVKKRSKTIGLIVPDIANVYFANMARGIDEACREHGFTVILCNTNESHERDVEYINMLADKGADGILYMEEELEKLIEQIQENEKKKRNLEFKALQQQINPHMIYNTLNTITRLAQLQGVSNIEEICCSFSNMLKLISKTTGDFITIRQEIAFIQSFITLKQYNSYKEYSLTTEISDEVWDKPIIKLLLHPLIENSITHGFTKDITIGRIMISIYASGGYIHIIMEDNGSGISEAALKELFSSSESDSVHAYKSTGIHNCMERLWLQYGSSRHFSIDSDGKTFTRIFIDYPEMEEVL